MTGVQTCALPICAFSAVADDTAGGIAVRADRFRAGVQQHFGTGASAGGGFHHLCFEVDNLTSELEKMEKNGARIIVQPTRGFENRLIAFVMLNLKHSNCNLIELVEKN